MNNSKKTLWQSAEFLFRTLDFFRFPALYEAIHRSLKSNMRSLTRHELNAAKSLFGDTIPYDRIRVNEQATLGPKQYHFIYVSFNTINSWGRIPIDIMMHELVHVWQYQQFGAVYIPRALDAQKSTMGYDYGGVEALQKAKKQQLSLLNFNYEQQADLVADYFRIQNGWPPRWGNGTTADLALYQYFVAQIKSIGIA